MKILRFNEANLNLGELDKPAPSLPTRGDVLIQKIKDEEEIIFRPPNTAPIQATVVNDEEVVDSISDDDGQYNREKAKAFFVQGAKYQPVIKASDDNDYKLNDIEKTIDFGSSGGRSLGTEETRNVECLQCLFFALRQKAGRTITEADILDLYDRKGKISKDYTKYIRVPVDIDYAMSLYSDNFTWRDTFITVANAMWESTPIFTRDKRMYQRSLDKNKKYIFFHIGYDGALTSAISSKYRELDTAGIPIPKWTPSDVWAINFDKESDIISNIERSTTFNRLNYIVNSEFTNNNLRGISLKKVSGVKKITIIINKVTPTPSYTFNRVVLSSNPLSNKGIRIIADRFSNFESNPDEIPSEGEENIDIRTFSGPTVLSDISGEVAGETARHGKVGLSRINRIISIISDEYNLEIDRIPTKDEISLSPNQLKREIASMQDMVLRYGASITSRSGQESVTTRASLISKYQSLKLAVILYQYTQHILKDEQSLSDRIIEDMFHYAMAIRNEEFECPKYIRMI